MEDTLRGNENLKQEKKESLNPCFNGRYSQRTEELGCEIIRLS